MHVLERDDERTHFAGALQERHELVQELMSVPRLDRWRDFPSGVGTAESRSEHLQHRPWARRRETQRMQRRNDLRPGAERRTTFRLECAACGDHGAAAARFGKQLSHQCGLPHTRLAEDKPDLRILGNTLIERCHE